MKPDSLLSPATRKTRQRKRAEVLEGAISICVTEGLEALTIHHLARKLGKTPGALYRYFSSKADLLVGIHKHLLSQLLAHFRETLPQQLDRLSETDRRLGTECPQSILKIVAVTKVYADLILKKPEQIKLLASFSADARVLIAETDEASFQESFKELFEFVAEPISEATKSGHFNASQSLSAIDRAVVLWASLQGLLVIDKLQRMTFLNVRYPMAAETVVAGLFNTWGFNGQLPFNSK